MRPGTSAAVALKAGRKFIGIDIDENAIATTRARIADDEKSRVTTSLDVKKLLGSSLIGQTRMGPNLVSLEPSLPHLTELP
jgi:hypothetical protein